MSHQQFDYVFKLPDGVACETARAFFDPDCELTIEAPFEGSEFKADPMLASQSVTEIKVHYGVCDYEMSKPGDIPHQQFHKYPVNDPNLPLEQKVSSPGDDDFPRDTVENDHKVFEPLSK